MTSELQQRKEVEKSKQVVESDSDANVVETISEPMAQPSEPVSNTNDDKESEPSETVKTHIDKKNE